MNLPVIDLHEYLEMSLVDRIIILQNNGVQIASVSTKLLRSELYVLGSFYVETRTKIHLSDDCVHDAIPFLKGPRLDKYLDTIDLFELLAV